MGNNQLESHWVNSCINHLRVRNAALFLISHQVYGKYEPSYLSEFMRTKGLDDFMIREAFSRSKTLKRSTTMENVVARL